MNTIVQGMESKMELDKRLAEEVRKLVKNIGKGLK